MLFGRKKPGFIVGEEPSEDSDGAGKPDLLAYMESLPEADDAEAGDGTEVSGEPDQELGLEDSKAVQVADYIRLRTRGIKLTSRLSLLKEIDDFLDIQQEWAADEACADIVFVEGDKDNYYYSNQFMSDNYAMIAALVLEKDIPRTIAKMVRFNCKTYPVPTPFNYFERSPYLYSVAQIARAAAVIENEREYEDIKSLKNNLGDLFFYSTEYMSSRYAKALADVDEYTD